MSPFSDISQNSTLEKQILHKIQYEENGLFTKFNIKKMDSLQNLIAFMFTFFRGCYTYSPFFQELKVSPSLFLEVKSKPCSFSTISRAIKAGLLPKIMKCIFEKICIRKIPAHKNSRFHAKSPFCF